MQFTLHEIHDLQNKACKQGFELADKIAFYYELAGATNGIQTAILEYLKVYGYKKFCEEQKKIAEADNKPAVCFFNPDFTENNYPTDSVMLDSTIAQNWKLNEFLGMVKEIIFSAN